MIAGMQNLLHAGNFLCENLRILLVIPKEKV